MVVVWMRASRVVSQWSALDVIPLQNDSSCATCALWIASGYSWSLECDEHSARVHVRVRVRKDSSCKILRIMWLIPKCKADRAVVILAPQKHASNDE
jgi:hypothetical protein